jgi:hypothetical protein
LGDPDATEVGVRNDEDLLRMFGEPDDQMKAWIGRRSGGPGDRGARELVAGRLGRLEVLDDEQDGGVGGGLHRSALIGAEADGPVEEPEVQLLSGVDAKHNRASETEVGAASQSEGQDGSLAGTGIEEYCRHVVMGLGVGEVRLAEGTRAVVVHAVGEVVCGVDEDAQSWLVAARPVQAGRKSGVDVLDAVAGGAGAVAPRGRLALAGRVSFRG